MFINADKVKFSQGLRDTSVMTKARSLNTEVWSVVHALILENVGFHKSLCLRFLNFSQCAKKVVPNSPELVDFAIGLVVFVLNLPDRQVLFFGEIQITEGL